MIKDIIFWTCIIYCIVLILSKVWVISVAYIMKMIIYIIGYLKRLINYRNEKINKEGEK